MIPILILQVVETRDMSPTVRDLEILSRLAARASSEQHPDNCVPVGLTPYQIRRDPKFFMQESPVWASSLRGEVQCRPFQLPIFPSLQHRSHAETAVVVERAATRIRSEAQDYVGVSQSLTDERSPARCTAVLLRFHASHVVERRHLIDDTLERAYEGVQSTVPYVRGQDHGLAGARPVLLLPTACDRQD